MQGISGSKQIAKIKSTCTRALLTTNHHTGSCKVTQLSELNRASTRHN